LVGAPDVGAALAAATTAGGATACDTGCADAAPMPPILLPWLALDKPPGRVVLLLLLVAGVSGRLPKKGGCKDIRFFQKIED
jgi:hypothetical protein